jgi:hypothetical protein
MPVIPGSAYKSHSHPIKINDPQKSWIEKMKKLNTCTPGAYMEYTDPFTAAICHQVGPGRMSATSREYAGILLLYPLEAITPYDNTY